MKKSINVGVFDSNLILQASPYCGDNIFAKGLEANDYSVTRFDYRAIQNPDSVLLEIANNIQPDLFWFGKCELISPDTLGILKSKFPNAAFIKWAADVRDKPTEHDSKHLRYIDLFVATFAGDYLKKHKELMTTKSRAVSIFAFTDSEFYKPMSVSHEWESDVLWTGRRSFGDNLLRNDIIDYLHNESIFDTRVYGIDKWLENPEYLYAINGTKVGIGANSFNRRKYSSDRLGNYMACGTFYLTQYIDGIEECFKQGIELDWFNSLDEMIEKTKYYIDHEKEREKIAKAGREFILKHFDYKPLVRNLLDILETDKTKNKWDEIY